MSNYELACTSCKHVERNEDAARCNNCGSSALSNDFSGLVIISDVENSEIAEQMSIKEPGSYALKVR